MTLLTIAALLILLAAGCTTRPRAVEVEWIEVTADRIVQVCRDVGGKDNEPLVGHSRGCSVYNRDARTCTIWAPDSDIKLGMSVQEDRAQREVMATLGHELKHCFKGRWH